MFAILGKNRQITGANDQIMTEITCCVENTQKGRFFIVLFGQYEALFLKLQKVSYRNPCPLLSFLPVSLS